MKCPLCNSAMKPEDQIVEVHSDGQFPDFMQDYWCDKGHLVQAIACEASTGWQVLILDNQGEELFSLWYTTKRELVDITDWQTSKQSWSQ
jgi:hypothetical protein